MTSEHPDPPNEPGALEELERQVEELRTALQQAVASAAPLRHTEERLRSLIEDASDPVFCYEADPPIATSLPASEQVVRLYECVLAECNEACARAYGARSRSEVLGRKLTELFGTRVGSLDGLFTDMIEGGYRTVDGEGVEVLPDGGMRYFLNNGHGVIEDGHLVRVWGTFRDITDRKVAEEALRDSEARYRQIVSNTSEAVVIFDADSRKVVEVNDAALRLYGYGRDKLLSLPYGALVAEPSDPDAAVEEMLACEPHSKALLHRHRAASGSLFPMEISARFLEVGGRTLVCAIGRNVSERLQLDEERERAARLESVGVLAGGIAHDFNNLLSAVLGNLSLLQLEGSLSVEARASLDDALAGCRQATGLTQQLLTFSRGGDPVRERTYLEELLRDTIRFSLRGTSASPTFDFGPDLRPVDADPGQLGQAVNNLAINARQAMPEGGTVRVHATNVSGDGVAGLTVRPLGYVCISVADQGIGMQRGLADRIFDPYFSTKGEGRGLGLAVVHSIMRKHNGLVTVESEPGRGTTFRLYLPASEHFASDQVTPGEPPPKGHGHILLMDDEPAVAGVAAKLLGKLGYTVDVVADGKEAVRRFTEAQEESEPYAAVILDLTVPGGVGGAQAVKGILARQPSARCIASSGYANDPVMADCVAHGFVAALPKPYDLRTVATLMRQTLAG